MLGLSANTLQGFGCVREEYMRGEIQPNPEAQLVH